MNIFSMKRMHRIFKEDGKSLIVAMDHGSTMNVFPALNDTEKVLSEIVENGADAFLTTFGIVKNYWNILKDCGIVLRIDGGITMIREGKKNYSQLFSVEEALKLGADAVGCMGLPGTDYENETLTYLANICAEAHDWGVPVLAEALPGGFNKSLHTSENIAMSARIAVEIGADIVKTEYPKDMEKFKEMSKGVFKPIVVLGGSKSDNPEDLLIMVKNAVDSGACGVAIGRNIWGYSEPGKMTKALKIIIHNGATVKEAMEELK